MSRQDTDDPVVDSLPWEGYFRSQVVRAGDDDFAEGTIREKHRLRADEPPWLEGAGQGDDEYPAPVDYLMFGLVSCQVEVLDQTLRKAGAGEFEIVADAEIDRMADGDQDDSMYDHHASRIRHISIDMTVVAPPEEEEIVRDCLDVYDSGCVVGQSYRTGIEYTSNKRLEIDG